MAAVQLTSARLGIVTGRGLAGIIRDRYGRRVLWLACLLLSVANVVNIGADLGAMGESTAMVTGIPSVYAIPSYTAAMILLMAFASYRRIAGVLKWMTLALCAYIVAAFLAHPSWSAVLHATLFPSLRGSASYLTTVIALLGTTISPYLFFWQARQEVEEIDDGRKSFSLRQVTREWKKRNSYLDVITGALYSNLIMYFIMLTAGANLNPHGQVHIATTREAAEALRPLAGRAAYLLFTLGIIGTGMLSVPVLAGSTAYAISEGAHWRDSLKDTPNRAPYFYFVLAAALIVGMALNYTRIGVITMLFWSAVVNGVLAAPLLTLMVRASSDRTIMGEDASPIALRVLGWAAAVVMAVAAVATFLSLFGHHSSP
jgi:Mn2+/Fe2+ NRAMP family transporter